MFGLWRQAKRKMQEKKKLETRKSINIFSWDFVRQRMHLDNFLSTRALTQCPSGARRTQGVGLHS